jgi:hypothetical protein
MTPSRCTLLILGCVAIAATACGSRPRQTPLPTTPVNEGPETMSAVRKQLEGRWALLSLNVTADDGRQQSIDASGLLASDAFGGLHIEYRLSEAGQKALAALGIKTPNPVISTSGRVVIDPQKKLITYLGEDVKTQGFDPDLAARRANPFALERPRFYEFGADGTLTLTSRYDNGKDAAVGRWKKAS